jgi:hypothetical protein
MRSERERNHGQVGSMAGAEARRSIASSTLRKLAGVVLTATVVVFFLSMIAAVLVVVVAHFLHFRTIAETAEAYLLAWFMLFGVLYGLMNGLAHRQARKLVNSPDFRAGTKKRQAETIQAMQEVSYWLDGTARTESPPRTNSMEVRVEALRLSREHVKKEIRRKGFNLYEVSAKEITKSAEALLAARPQAMIEQAKDNVAKWRSR